MNTEQLLIKNHEVLTRFDQLQAQKKNPQLAIYRGKELRIISYQTNNVLEKIFLVFKRIFNVILECFGILDTNKERLQKLKIDLYFYRLSKSKNQYSYKEFKNSLIPTLMNIPFLKDSPDPQCYRYWKSRQDHKTCLAKV